MNKGIIILVLTILVFLSGCSLTGQTTKEFACNEPYIQVGSECCLDQNSNNICDGDESEIIKDKVEKINEQQLESGDWKITQFPCEVKMDCIDKITSTLSPGETLPENIDELIQCSQNLCYFNVEEM